MGIELVILAYDVYPVRYLMDSICTAILLIVTVKFRLFWVYGRQQQNNKQIIILY